MPSQTRTSLIAGNWKMNTTFDLAKELTESILPAVSASHGEIMIAPPHPFLHHVGEIIEDTPIMLGAQDMSAEISGAYTGQVSAEMLVSLKVEFVILGHSERRAIFDEKNSLINRKIKLALTHRLIPILCVGEKALAREDKKHFNVISTQIRETLEGVSYANMEAIVLAYEPIWAIGTGIPAKAKDVNETHHFIRELIASDFSQKTAERVRILYGGSVNEENVDEFMEMEHIDGCLVGSAALDAKKFSRIIGYQI